MANLKFSWAFVACLLGFYLTLVAGQNCPYANVSSKGSGSAIPDLIDITVDEIAAGLESGQYTSVDLVKAYLARINEVNPQLNAVTEQNPDALSIAQTLDDERKAGKIRGPLHGVPILIKNNIATMDKMNNTAGSYALLGAKVPRDSTIAAKLRAAGVVILGKANLSQWANYRSNNSTSGWSAYGGQVFGAYYPQQDPSGSSSGSAVGSSIGLALAALGSETDGSILSPSDVNSLVGIKPTVGLTSRSLVIPISQHQDTVGPLARTVKDAAYVLAAIAGKDENDNYTSAIPFDPLPDYVGACNFSSFLGARIGIPRNAIASDPSYAPVLSAFETAIQTISKAGATIVDNANYSGYAEYEASNDGNETIVLNADLVSGLANYLAQLTFNPQNVHTLADVSNYTHQDPREDWPDRDTGLWDESLAMGYNNTDGRFWAAYQADLYFGGPGGVDGALEKDNLDALILPTTFSPSIPALVGYPVISVPLGYYPSNTTVQRNDRNTLVEAGPNIPFGLSFIGKAFSEATLISFAYAYEQRTLTRNKVLPYLVPNTEIVDILSE